MALYPILMRASWRMASWGMHTWEEEDPTAQQELRSQGGTKLTVLITALS
jgi:hypothetical protein